MEDYFDNDELNEMFNNDNNENSDKYSNIPEEEFEGMVEEMERFRFEKMVHENYKNIKEKGIDILTMASFKANLLIDLKQPWELCQTFLKKMKNMKNAQTLEIFQIK